MLTHRMAWLAATVMGVGILALLVAAPGTSAKAALDVGSPLSGAIRAAAGGALEGVAVSAQPVGKTFTISVFTDERGEYFLPPLEAPFEDGTYLVWAQAVGYETARAEVHLGRARPARQDLTLKTVKDFARQLSGAEWLAALPADTREDRRMKEIFRVNCTECHQAGLVFQNRLDEQGWLAIIEVMERATYHGWGGPTNRVSPIIAYHKQELATYLARVSGPGPSPMKFKLQPRPTGEAARHVVTEYDIPIAELPTERASIDGSEWSEGIPSGLHGGGGMHDVAVDNNGNAWITDSVPNAFRTVAKVETKTGQVTGYKLTAPNGVAARGSHGIIRARNGIIWFDTNGSLARLDPATETFELHTPPAPLGVGGSPREDGKGKIWIGNRHGVLQFDPDTKKFRYFQNKTIGDGQTYGNAGDALGNGWWAQFNQDIVGYADAATGQVDEVRMRPPWAADQEELLTPADRAFYHNTGVGTYFGTFARPGSQAPRRLSADLNGNTVWVANWWGYNLAKIDIKTRKATYYRLPIDSHPYATVVDRNHMVWTNLSSDDAVAKFDPKTEKYTVYKLPSIGAELRYIAVDDNTGPDVWVVYRESSRVARIQFRTPAQLQALKSASSGPPAQP